MLRANDEAYLEVLKEANRKENDAIAIGLKLIALAPPGDRDKLIEITNDENNHSIIYSSILARYEKDE